MRGDVTTAYSAVCNCIKTLPDERIFRVWCCIQLVEQRQIEEAIAQISGVQTLTDQIERVFLYLNQKKKLVMYERVIKKANQEMEKKNYATALNHFNVCVLLCSGNIEALRGRMQCYEKIGEVKKWMKDLSRILQLAPNVADYCLRGQYYQSQGEDMKACDDFISALEISELETRETINVNSNGESVLQLFHNTALVMADLNEPKTVARLCESGLTFDPNHKGLRHLKERSNVNKCIIQ